MLMQHHLSFVYLFIFLELARLLGTKTHLCHPSIGAHGLLSVPCMNQLSCKHQTSNPLLTDAWPEPTPAKDSLCQLCALHFIVLTPFTFSLPLKHSLWSNIWQKNLSAIYFFQENIFLNQQSILKGLFSSTMKDQGQPNLI